MNRNTPATHYLENCSRLEHGLVDHLWSTPPREFEARSYAHVCDRYALYSLQDRYLLEFEEWHGGKSIYRALFLNHRPTKQRIGSIFFQNTQGGRWCFEMQEFDELSNSSRRSAM